MGYPTATAWCSARTWRSSSSGNARRGRAFAAAAASRRRVLCARPARDRCHRYPRAWPWTATARSGSSITLFSCLCTLDGVSSFAPAWRPRFSSATTPPRDRCHLNGLAVRDLLPALRHCPLARPTRPQNWRANKRDGGILIDLDSDEIITRGRPCRASAALVRPPAVGARIRPRGALVTNRPGAPASARTSRACPASCAAWTSSVRWRSSVRGCARDHRSPTSRSPTTTSTGRAGCGRCT